MSLDNLDSPLRITWELCPPGKDPLSADALLQVANKLIDAGIFFLHLDEKPLLHPGLQPVLNKITDSGCQVSFVIGDSVSEWERLRVLEGNFTLMVDAGCWITKDDGLNQLENVFKDLAAKGRVASMLWVPDTAQMKYLHPLIEICKRQNVPRFKLPNRKIGATSEPVEAARLLQLNDLEELKNLVQKQPVVPGETALEVHDLFLWELIFPQGGGERTEYGGCQAGNSLGHVTVSADVWPCSSWPLVLGNLLQQDLESAWESTERFQVRVEVAAEPSDCDGCRDYPICYGGCRGLARSYRSDGGKRDILCNGPR